MASEGLHEAAEHLQPSTIDRHRAVVSLKEELEAIDWYDQRIDATHDPDLRAVLIHNRDEEKEHAALVLEWLRQHDPKLEQELRKHLFNPQPLVERARQEEEAQGGAPAAPSSDGSLGIRSLRAGVSR